jgi:hypothetical protein
MELLGICEEKTGIGDACKCACVCSCSCLPWENLASLANGANTDSMIAPDMNLWESQT